MSTCPPRRQACRCLFAGGVCVSMDSARREGRHGAPGSLGGPCSSAHHWPALLLKGTGRLGNCMGQTCCFADSCPCLGAVLSLRRYNLRKAPAPVDHPVLSAVGITPVLSGRLECCVSYLPPTPPLPPP